MSTLFALSPPEVSPSDDDLQELQPRLTSDDATLRRLALIELAELEDEAHAPWLAWALREPDPAIRADVAARLAYWEQPVVLNALVDALHDEVPAVREAAAYSLAEIKQADSGTLLLPALEGAQGFVLASLLHAIKELRLPGSLNAALRATSDRDAPVRLAAVGVLGWLKDASALPVLTHLAAHDPDPEVRRAAVGALGLGQGHDAQVQPALLGALQDPVWRVREEAAATLGKLKLPEAVTPLIQSLQDAYWQVRQLSARALGRLKAAQAVDALITYALRHDIANLRKEACVALGEIGHASALSALTVGAQDPDPEVRKMARLAITLIQQRAAA